MSLVVGNDDSSSFESVQSSDKENHSPPPQIQPIEVVEIADEILQDPLTLPDCEQIKTILGENPTQVIKEGPEIHEEITGRWKSFIEKGIDREN